MNRRQFLAAGGAACATPMLNSEVAAAIMPKGPMPLLYMTEDQLYDEWLAGMYFDSAIGLTRAQEDRLIAIEREMERRESQACGC